MGCDSEYGWDTYTPPKRYSEYEAYTQIERLKVNQALLESRMLEIIETLKELLDEIKRCNSSS